MSPDQEKTARQAMIHRAKLQLQDAAGVTGVHMPPDIIQSWALIDIAESLIKINENLSALAAKKA